MTPLHVAAEKARIGTLKYLIDQNAEVNFQDQNEVNIPYTVCKYCNTTLHTDLIQYSPICKE